MLPLKKTFPIIVVLITLSLLGIIAIQVSWIRNAAILRKEQLEQNFVSVVNNVRDEMVRRQAPPIRFKMGGTTLSKGADNSITLEKYELSNITVGVSDRFTTDEVQELITNALRKQKLDTSY